MNLAHEQESPVKPTLSEMLGGLKDRRIWRIFVLGIASGYPWVIIGGSTLSVWLRESGFSRTSIGLFSLVFTAYTINFLWAPILDAVKFKRLSKIGQRRSWILICQIAIIAITLAMATVGPNLNIYLFALLAVGIGFFSATQDLAIDAYRITVIPESEGRLISLGAAMATCGWWVGFGVPGALLLYCAEIVSWQWVYVVAAGLIIPITVLVLMWFEEPKIASVSHEKNWFANVLITYVDTVTEFFRRNGVGIAFGLLLFIFLFKIGEAFLGRMVAVFYIEVGYSKAEIATFSKLVSTSITIVFALFAGVLMPRVGVFKMLLWAGLLMAATNLMFAWIAWDASAAATAAAAAGLEDPGPSLVLFMAAVVSDGITSSVSTVAFVSFLTFYVSRLHAAGQYGALASLGNAGRTLLAGTSGLLVDQLGGDWALFFVITSVAVVPSLLLLLAMGVKLARTGRAPLAQ